MSISLIVLVVLATLLVIGFIVVSCLNGGFTTWTWLLGLAGSMKRGVMALILLAIIALFSGYALGLMH